MLQTWSDKCYKYKRKTKKLRSNVIAKVFMCQLQNRIYFHLGDRFAIFADEFYDYVRRFIF